MSFRSSARLRLRPPARRKPARKPLPRGLGSVALLLVGGLAGAYLLYAGGVPGSPRLPSWDGVTSTDESAYRSGDGMTLLVPPGVTARQRVLLGKTDHLYGEYTTFNPVDPMLDLDPGTVQVSVELRGHRLDPFDLILQLDSGARVPRDGMRAYASAGTDHVAIDGPYSKWQMIMGSSDPPRFDTDYYVLHVDPSDEGARFDLLLRPFWPFAVRDNARVVLRTALFHGAVECDNIDAVVGKLMNGRGGTFDAPFFCTRVEPDRKSETVVVLDIERAEWKTDLLYPAPADDIQDGVPDGATWWSATRPLRVTGNYVNINAEAAGQRSLFLAGLMAGFALGLVPVIVEKVRYPTGRTAARGTGSRSRRWSRARRR